MDLSKQYKGNSFIAEDYWPYASLIYRGKKYSGFQINYDLYEDDLILLFRNKERRNTLF